VKTNTESWPGRICLMVSHCAGMIDLVALPVWVGALISKYGFDPQQAGALVTMFLAGAVLSSLFFASRFNRVPSRLAAAAGFGIAALAFVSAALVIDFGALALLHVIAGASAGCGLSFTHGTVGRATNPHRLCSLRGCFEIGCQECSSSSNALASFRSRVSKPSVNQP
jgi:MFS family permease